MHLIESIPEVGRLLFVDFKTYALWQLDLIRMLVPILYTTFYEYTSWGCGPLACVVKCFSVFPQSNDGSMFIAAKEQFVNQVRAPMCATSTSASVSWSRNIPPKRRIQMWLSPFRTLFSSYVYIWMYITTLAYAYFISILIYIRFYVHLSCCTSDYTFF